MWVNDGCSVDKTEHGFTVCECDHLTNFALLMVNIPKFYPCSCRTFVIGELVGHYLL